MIAMNYDTDTTQNDIMITMITYKKRLLHGYPLVKRLQFANWTAPGVRLVPKSDLREVFTLGLGVSMDGIYIYNNI